MANDENQTLTWLRLRNFINKMDPKKQLEPVNLLVYSELVGCTNIITATEQDPDGAFEKGDIFLVANY